MAEFGSNRIDRIRQLCRKLKPVLGSKMDQLFLAYSAEDKEGREQIETYLEALAGKYLSGNLDQEEIHLVPPTPEQVAGPYELGTVQYAGKDGSEFGLRENEWIQHLGVFGRSGAGKTNLGFWIFRQLLQHRKPVLVFDWKRNYRDLLAFPEFKDVEIYTVGRDVAPFSFNPLIPPAGTEPKTWLKQLIEVVAHAYSLGNGVLFLLQEALDGVYEEFGVYSGQVTRWPTFRDVMKKAKAREVRGRESAWMSSTLRALSSLCFGHTDKVLNSQTNGNNNIPELITKSVILEMDSLGQADKIFLISSLLLFIHHLRMTEGKRELFKHAIIIEEAHHVLSNEKRSFIGGQSVMEITFREIREFGESILILDQSPSSIAHSALANAYCTICLNLKHQKDVSAMAQSMLLDGDEKDILGSLEVGEAVVKLQGRVAKPFKIRIPEFEIRKGTFDDNMVCEKMAGVIQNFAVEDSIKIPFPGSESETIAPAEPQRLDSREFYFLQDVRYFPNSGVAARYKRIKLSVRQGQKLKERLARQGLIQEHEERTEIGRIRFIRLTEKGGMSLGEKDKTA